MKTAIGVNNLTKEYPNGTVALRGVDLHFEEGEIHALLGENGAGKTTLMKILYGLEQPTSGAVTIEGETVKITSVMEAIRWGIGMVSQHFTLIDSMSIQDNITLGCELTKGLRIDHEKQTGRIQEEFKGHLLSYDLTRRVRDLRIGEKQSVEIMKLLVRDAKILIFDEPTAVLTPDERTRFLEELVSLKAMGKTILLVSHKLEEVLQVADSVTLLREGVVEQSFRLDEANRERVYHFFSAPKEEETQPFIREKKPLFDWVNRKPPRFEKPVSFGVGVGEIVGLLSMKGDGGDEIINALREDPQTNISWRAEIKNRKFPKLGYIPADRLAEGVALSMSIHENLCLHQVLEGQMITDHQRLREQSKERVRRFDIRCSDLDQPVASLSGGNIQKLIVARECREQVDLLLAHEPGRGIDPMAAKVIYRAFFQFVKSGGSILFTGNDLEEMSLLCDRVIVLYERNISEVLERPIRAEQLEMAIRRRRREQ